MSAPVSPRFLPWLRTGLASYITEEAVDGIAPGDTASISVAVQLTASGGSDYQDEITSPAIRLRGPAEVIGIDQSLIVRRDPEPGETDAERNYFALVEFSAPDLPWRYTPARPAGNSADRLQPWIALVVVEEREGVWLETGPHCRLPILHVDDAERELPDLAQCWAWAHVHADHDLKDGVSSGLETAPGAFRSRLMCPRRLSPRRGWIACVVPVFKAGLQAGLGLPVVANGGLAWDQGSGEIDIPVYHHWRFRTGPQGDFESLVKRLKARQLPEEVGRRDLDISQPGGSLPKGRKVVISYQGALISLAGQPKPWPQDHRGLYQAEMVKLLNAGLDQSRPGTPYDALEDDPVVGPPAYTAQQAQQREIPPAGKPPVWLGEVNTEPQHRAAAGLGTQVVRRDQESLMASAWEFAASAAEAGRILTRARTAEEVGKRAKQNFDRLADEEFIQIAGPAMARLQHASGKTIRGMVNTSALPGGLFSGAFRRLARSAPGLRKVSARRRMELSQAVTRKAIQDPLDFVNQWAAVQSPANADVENDNLQGARMLAIEIAGMQLEYIPRIEVVGIPYTGDTQHLNTLVSASRAALDPGKTIHAMVQKRIKNLSLASGQEVPDRIFIRPRFTTPMYQRLAALSVEYLVPGIGDIPNDTLGLLETNPPFIEAYLAGLNHEMGREFLWREYPARLSDTWFQYFWNSGSQGAADIRPIRGWPDSARLGQNAPERAPQASLVLLIRSALLRRYPDLRVYAVEALWKTRQNKQQEKIQVRREKLDGEVYQPVFTARLTSDITVFGFTLDENKARGSIDPDKHPGYFFVLEQPPGSPRFGLDEQRRPGSLNHWTNLSWPDLAGEDGQPPTFVDVTQPPGMILNRPLQTNSDDPQARDTWGSDSAAMARITFQRPVRMLVHADSMLPAAPTRPNPKDRKW